MAEFDYARAWKTLAEPQFLSLPASVIEVLYQVVADCEGLSQGSDLRMIWPGDGAHPLENPGGNYLWEAFKAIPTATLAHASRVIWSMGHWEPLGVTGIPGGAHWKFSNYADQVLRDRLGLPQITEDKKGIGYEIHEGMIRLTFSRGCWIWKEVGLATRGSLEQIRREVLKSEPVRRRDFGPLVTRVRALAPTITRQWLNLDPFMVPETSAEKAKVRWDGLVEDTCVRIAGLEHINHRPHPFTIGPNHLKGDSLVLDPDSAPCAHRGCALSYNEHESDYVVVLAPARDGVTEDEVKPVLEALVKELEADKLDGFVFTSPYTLETGEEAHFNFKKPEEDECPTP